MKRNVKVFVGVTDAGNFRVLGLAGFAFVATWAWGGSRVVPTGAAELLLPQKTLLDVQTNAVCGKPFGSLAKLL